MEQKQVHALRKMILTLNASHLALLEQVSQLETLVIAMLGDRVRPELLEERKRIQANGLRLRDSHRQLLDQALKDLDEASG